MTEVAAKTWIAIDVTVGPDAAEAVEFAFNELGSIGTEIIILPKSNCEPVVVTGYFEEMPDDEVLQACLEDAFRIHSSNPASLKSVAFRTIENTDWLVEWKKHWKPTVVDGFIIAPPWEKIEDPGKIVITIEPNMAFGTGTHETTQLCLRAIGENYRPDQTFLDVGTGTGILAIAAAKLAANKADRNEVEGKGVSVNSLLSAPEILACDTDADSIKIAKQNAELNGVGENIRFFDGGINEETPVFDFVCANLTIDVIVPILPLLLEKTGEILVLSGILVEQEKQVKTELSNAGVWDFDVEHAGEWISVLVNIPLIQIV